MSDNLGRKKYLAMVLILMLVAIALITVWTKEPGTEKREIEIPESTTDVPSATTQPTMTATRTSTPSPTSTSTAPPPSPTTTQVPTITPLPTITIQLSGQFILSTEMIGGLVHEGSIQLPEQITVEVHEEEPGAIILEAEPPWVNVSGIISSKGSISATGTGIVGGYSDVSVLVTGTLEYDYFTGYLTMGTKRELPGGEAGEYIIEGPFEAQPSIPTPIPSPVVDGGLPVTETFSTFVSDFNFAMQHVDIEWLINHLHPAVFARYNPEECQYYLERTVQPEFEIVVINLRGPELWSWELNGVVIEINDAYTAVSELMVKGDVQQTDVHFAVVDEKFTWFTTCINQDE